MTALLQALTALEALASLGHSSHPAPRLALGAQGGDFMSRRHRLISPTAPTLLAPRAGLVVLLLLAGGYGVQARARVTTSAQAGPEEALAKGTVRLRRHDVDSPDGQAKAGTIDMLVHSASLTPATAARPGGSDRLAQRQLLTAGRPAGAMGNRQST